MDDRRNRLVAAWNSPPTTFPAQGSGEDAPTDGSQRATNAGRLTAPTPLILIADADADTRALYRDSFTRAGYDVVEATDGCDALIRALKHPPTLVITEIRLPLVDGYAVCETLRRGQTTADIPILVVTSQAHPADANRARQAGADAVLVKPTTQKHMLREARRLLARAQDMRGRATATRANTEGEKSANLVTRSEARHRTPLSKSFSRFTTNSPPAAPPQLRCPSCDRPLTYERSEIGGVSHRQPEQWDYYACATCGTFQHRQRTHKLRHVE
jgi:CheY-like chemotaxis protein